VGFVDFVGEDLDNLRTAAEEFGGSAVEGIGTFAGVDDEEDEVRLVDGETDLLLDVFAEVVAVDDAVAAGVDQFKVETVNVTDVDDAIAGHAGSRFNNALAASGERVEETALSDVGATYDSDDW